ncbi:MAG: hypothetical protein SO206_02615 [Bacilli bacterium]|nr:hypothetical protein [Bacilli bacterium]
MKKVKKIFSSTLCFALLFSLLSVTSVSAETENKKIDFSQKDKLAISKNSAFIENSYEALLKDAIANGAPRSNQETLNAIDSNETMQVNTYIIQDEIISTDIDSDSELHAVTYASEIIPLRAGGHKYEEGSDGAYAVTAYSTLYYSTQDHSGNTLYCLTQVTGGYTKIVGVSVTSQTVVYGMSGIGVGAPVNLSGTKHPTGTTFSYNTGFNSYVTTASSSHIGCTYTLTIRRGTGTYNYSLYNNL